MTSIKTIACVCMYVHVCVCMCVCMCVYVCVCWCVCVIHGVCLDRGVVKAQAARPTLTLDKVPFQMGRYI